MSSNQPQEATDPAYQIKIKKPKEPHKDPQPQHLTDFDTRGLMSQEEAKKGGILPGEHRVPLYPEKGLGDQFKYVPKE